MKIQRLVVAKIHPLKESMSTWGEFRTVELLDPNDNFKHYITYIDESNRNYQQWHKIFKDDYNEYAFVIEGDFKTKRKVTKNNEPIINGDARFNITAKANRQEVLWEIANSLED